MTSHARCVLRKFRIERKDSSSRCETNGRDAVHRKRRNNPLLLNSKRNQLNRSVNQRIHDVNNVASSRSNDNSRTHSDERNVRQVRRKLNGLLDLCDNSRRAKESPHQRDHDRSNDA